MTEKLINKAAGKRFFLTRSSVFSGTFWSCAATRRCQEHSQCHIWDFRLSIDRGKPREREAVENPSSALSPFPLQRLIEYHTPISLVEACLGAQCDNSAAFLKKFLPASRDSENSSGPSSISFLSPGTVLRFWCFVTIQSHMESILKQPVTHGTESKNSRLN